MSDVLVTGGVGFFGFQLAKQLVNHGYHVHLVDNLARGVIDKEVESLLRKPGVMLSQIDLLDTDAVFALGSHFESIVHLAAIIGVQHVVERPYDVLLDNTRTFDNIIKLAQKQNNLSRLLFASSSEVYAGTLKYFQLEFPTPESSALTVSALNEPRTSYMLSKIMGEAMCHQSNVPYTIFRPHNIYGPRMGMAHVIPEQLKKAFEAKPGDELGVHSADHTRTFCYIDDAVEMLLRMLETKSCVGQTLNVGTEIPEVTIREIGEMCAAVSGKNLNIKELSPTLGSPQRRIPGMQLARDLLSIEPQIGLEEGIKKTWDWYRVNVFENDGHTAL